MSLVWACGDLFPRWPFAYQFEGWRKGISEKTLRPTGFFFSLEVDKEAATV